MGQTGKGVPYPDSADAPDGPGAVKAVADFIDAQPGIAPLTYAQIQALDGEQLWAGRVAYQTDTGTARPISGLYTFNGVAWRLPWSQPWGVLPNGYAQITDNQDGNGATVAVAGLSLTNVVVANRRIKVSVAGRVSQNSAGIPIVSVNDGVTHELWSVPLAGATPACVSGHYVSSPPAGSITHAVEIESSPGTTDLVASDATPVSLLIEDIGPATGAPS